jgi:hypothetical protein
VNEMKESRAALEEALRSLGMKMNPSATDENMKRFGEVILAWTTMLLSKQYIRVANLKYRARKRRR